ncbi:MAG: Cna B-type domain-containing protein, partial [Clostridium sp.]|nr:Cna B-type domain-containing protein [Clostridium sp.]
AFVNQKSQNDDTVSVTVTKVWKDNNSVNRPDSVSVQLYKDGVAYGDAVTLDARSHWSYTWNDLDSELTWTVDEVNVPSGYTKTVSHRANDWTITNEKNGNTPTPPVPGKDTGNLIVSKVVAGNAGSQTIAFHFTVTLNDTSINGTFGNMTFEDGVAMFTLKHGEQKTASALPAGVRYTVTETEANQDGYTTTVTGKTGMVVASKTVAAAFTNTKNVGSDGEGSNDDNEYGNLTVSKTVTGKAGDFDQIFTFTIKLDCSISGKYGDMHFNKGAAVITLKHGESSTATKLPAGTHYTVTESDNDGYTVTAVGDTGVIRDGKTAVAAFTNHKDTTPVTPNDPTPPTPDPTNPIEPATPDEPSNPENPTDPTQPTDPVPQTGDETNIGLWFTLMLCSFVAFVGICIYERKHRYSGRHVRRRNNE